MNVIQLLKLDSRKQYLIGSHDVGPSKCVSMGYAHGTHRAQMTQGDSKYFPVLIIEKVEQKISSGPYCIIYHDPHDFLSCLKHTSFYVVHYISC